MQSLVVVTGEAEIIPVKPDAGNAAVGMSRILSFVRTLLCTSLIFFNCNIRTMDSKYIPTLTIAGSDSCGGAGLQADIKTMSALGCYACSVVTAVTAQDTLRVHQVMDVPVAMVVSQLHAVLNDISPVAIKTGMIGNAEIAAAVAVELETAPRVPLVVDPVMVATSGDPLMRAGTLYIVTGRLLPLATIVTPNIPEAEAMADMKIVSDDDVWTAAARILNFGCKAVLIKGGHAEGTTKTDRLLTADGTRHEYCSATINTPNTHGTGCTLSSAITAFLARGCRLDEAVGKAKEYLEKALDAGKEVAVGHGHGAVDHFFNPEKLIIKR